MNKTLGRTTACKECLKDSNNLPEHLKGMKPKAVNFMKSKLMGQDKLILSIVSTSAERTFHNLATAPKDLLTVWPTLENKVFENKE